jgi:hypothetical protein
MQPGQVAGRDIELAKHNGHRVDTHRRCESDFAARCVVRTKKPQRAGQESPTNPANCKDDENGRTTS